MKTGGRCSPEKDAEAGVVPETCSVAQREPLQIRSEGRSRLPVEGLEGRGQGLVPFPEATGTGGGKRPSGEERK